MPCFRNLTAYRTNSVNPETGKRGITFSRSSGFTDMELLIPCGKCLGCLAKRKNEWALRCTHEASLHEHSCFITLTYNDDNLPSDLGLHHSDFQKFMKRLRKAHPKKKIRYFMCGEYGGLNQRPHFHALLFGVDFPDMIHWDTTGKVKNYISAELAGLWDKGFHTIGSVHYGTARYVAKYSQKQLDSLGIDYGDRRPEYRKMSQGIGAGWAEKYASELALHDSIVLNGVKNPVPRYYEKFLSPEDLQRIKDNRVKYMRKARKKPEQEKRAAEANLMAKEKLFGN